MIGCSEPFTELSKNRDILNVVDGKISNLPGASYIRIFEQINDSTQIPIPNLNVSVINGDGEAFPFTFESNRYIPSSAAFKADIGVQYRFEATNESITIESSFDLVPDSIPLSMTTVDTFITILTGPLNLVQKVDAVAAVALISSEGNHRARLRFEHSYINPLNDMVETTTFDEYALYACENTFDCNSSSTRVPIGTTTQRSWIFLNSLRIDCLNTSGEVDISNGCVFPCCLRRDDYLTTFRVYAESMSPSIF